MEAEEKGVEVSRPEEILEAAQELSKAISREEFYAAIEVPGAIQRAALQTEGVLALFSRVYPPEKDKARMQKGIEMIVLISRATGGAQPDVEKKL